MSEPNSPKVPGSAGGVEGPLSRPDSGGLPPKTGGDVRRPGADDARDPGMEGEGGLGEDTGGMIDEG